MQIIEKGIIKCPHESLLHHVLPEQFLGIDSESLWNSNTWIENHSWKTIFPYLGFWTWWLESDVWLTKPQELSWVWLWRSGCEYKSFSYPWGQKCVITGKRWSLRTTWYWFALTLPSKGTHDLQCMGQGFMFFRQPSAPKRGVSLCITLLSISVHFLLCVGKCIWSASALLFLIVTTVHFVAS